jgi:amino acid adenylation domain-containing protein
VEPERTAVPGGPELSPSKRALLAAILGGQATRPSAIPRVARGGDLPVSFAQERLWFLDRLGEGGTAYNVTNPLRLTGAVDEAALERALGEVVRRHEALRTVFREVDGAPRQVVLPFGGVALPVEDLSALAVGEREARVRERVADEGARRFDFAAGPLFRAALLRLGAEERVLLLSMHHVACDGWGAGVLFRELWTLYAAFREGRPSPLPEPPIQYADFAAWQRGRAGSEAHGRELAYWRARLAGAPELLELPADRPRPPRPSMRGAAVPVRVPAAAAGPLRELARREGATLFMAVLAAFQVVLARWSGQDDVVVGTLVAGRTRAEVEELVGLFMNTLALRADLSGDPAFRELLGRVRDDVLGAYDHQEVPFERVVAELQPRRTLSHSPLFQVVFQLDEAGSRSAPAPASAGPGGLRVRGEAEEVTAEKVDLTLVLSAGAEGIGGTLSYSTDLFDRATALRMVEHLGRVLAQVAADPALPLSRIALLGADERRRVVEEWNRTAAPYPADRCIHQLFEAQAARTPDAVAVAFGGRSLAYRELDARANRLASHLAGLGVGPEVRVGICLERGLEPLVCILGVMKAGGAWVPVDPGHPAERQGYVLADSGVAVLLTQARLAHRLPDLPGVRVIAVDREWERIAAEPAEAPRTGVTAENLAYVIYTSGSTGRPKGVAMHHRGVCNYIDWGIGFYGADRGNGSPVFSSLAVDLTLTNFLPLFAGRTVHFLPEENAVEALAAALRERRGYGAVKITPVHLTLLTPLLTADEAKEAAHTLVIGADFLPAEPTVFWQEHAPGVRLMNEYGPTETVVGCSAYVLPNGVHRAGPVPVGGPIQNLAFYVLDERMEPVPVGLPGELYIGGAGVARGYLGRPALTAEKFVPDPFGGAGARMYRSGDRARWLEGGNLMVLGRADGQVKLRGYRVELGEIEAVLRRHPSVTGCLAVVREDRPGDRRLVAYVAATGPDAGAAALRAHLLRSLPEYMVPAAFVVMDALPRTATGKLDPRALPAPVYGAEGREPDEPHSYLEARLLQLWEELLGVEGIGATDDFFELGGNSLLALRLFTRVNRALGCDLPVATLFEGPTVRHMARAVEAQSRADAAPPGPVVPLQPHGALPPLFLVHAADRNVMGYVNLVRHLGGGQPAYGIRDLGDLRRPVARIAAEHVAALRQVQPRGPYYLAGWSFGGTVAFEMALQLERAGEGVAFVGLLDTVSPTLWPEWEIRSQVDAVVGFAREFAERGRRPFSLDPGELEGLPFDELLRRAVEALHAQEAVPPAFTGQAIRAACEAMWDRAASVAGYAGGRFGGTLTLFRASIPSERERHLLAARPGMAHDLGWSAHAARVDVRRVPGTHATLGAEPHVRDFAARMRQALEAARAGAGSAAGEPPAPLRTVAP